MHPNILVFLVFFSSSVAFFLAVYCISAPNASRMKIPAWAHFSDRGKYFPSVKIFSSVNFRADGCIPQDRASILRMNIADVGLIGRVAGSRLRRIGLSRVRIDILECAVHTRFKRWPFLDVPPFRKKTQEIW